MNSLRKQITTLEKKSKVGWALFYQSSEDYHELFLEYHRRVKELEDKIKDESVPQFIIEEIKELYKDLNKSLECPICFETLETKDIKFSSCGHKYCNTCLKKLNECAICRRKIYK